MELRHLRYFVAVAEQGNVSQAARKLFIAQPPLSQQLKQLEEEIGTPLFVRLPRGVRLTPAGESLLEDARAILARAEQAPVRARERWRHSQLVLRLGLVPSAMQSVLPALIRQSQDEQWDVQWEAREMISSHQERALRQGQLDLGIARPGGPIEGLEIASMDDPYCLALPMQHPLAQTQAPLDLAEAMHEAFVGYTRYQDTDYFDRTLALCMDAGFMPLIRHEASQLINALSLVASGLGVVIVPASFALLGVEGVVFRPLKAPRYASRLVVLASPTMMELNPQVARAVRAAVALLERMSLRRA
ncbi:MAG: LysR substrate-binding domain-containing protein [Comamonas sp.]